MSRGGQRVPGPGKTLGAPHKAPSALTVKKGPFRFPPDVADILGRQRNATRFICDAVRRLSSGQEVELRVAIIECRCGTDSVLVNGEEGCPNGCPPGAGTVKSDERTVSVKIP